MLTSIHHIGIAVSNLEEGKALYASMFGLSSFHEEIIESQKVKIASFFLQGILIELTAPTSEDSPIAQFILKKGEGIHHIAFTSDTIQDDLDKAKNNGINLIHHIPIAGAHEMMIAFLHPKSTHGVLMEFCQPISDLSPNTPLL